MIEENDKSVNVAPTKRFFISVLVKDIYLIDAIVELVDNSVDAARTRYGREGLSQIVINIAFDKDSFCITDNAGGISIAQAKSYAFRFGRSEDAPTTPGTVGEFGVGMKRALFKLGNKFEISSKTKTEFFHIPVDVPKWEKMDDGNPSSWNFEFSELGTNPNSNDVGTEILVSELFPNVAEEFSNPTFGTRLTALLQEAHNESLALGLQITINNRAVHGVPPELLQSSSLQPIHQSSTFDVMGKSVTFTIIAGAGSPSLPEAGWYVFCNGRQIERAEKSEKTGWNSAIDRESTPKAHWQYRRFRGYVFFESDHADVLPWNTTKTSLNIESDAYRRVFPDMQAALRQVISFLNALDGEGNDGGTLSDIITAASSVPITRLAASPTFKYTASGPTIVKPKMTRISYAKETELVESVKEYTGLRSNKDLGEYTFQYFVDNEGLDG